MIPDSGNFLGESECYFFLQNTIFLCLAQRNVYICIYKASQMSMRYIKERNNTLMLPFLKPAEMGAGKEN